MRRRVGWGKVAKSSLRKSESWVVRGMLRSTCERESSMSLSYCTPEGQAVMQAMQPRQVVLYDGGRSGRAGRYAVGGFLHHVDAAARGVHLFRPRERRWGRRGGRIRSGRSRRVQGIAPAAMMWVEAGRPGRGDLDGGGTSSDASDKAAWVEDAVGVEAALDFAHRRACAAGPFQEQPKRESVRIGDRSKVSDPSPEVAALAYSR